MKKTSEKDGGGEGALLPKASKTFKPEKKEAGQICYWTREREDEKIVKSTVTKVGCCKKKRALFCSSETGEKMEGGGDFKTLLVKKGWNSGRREAEEKSWGGGSSPEKADLTWKSAITAQSRSKVGWWGRDNLGGYWT